MVLATQNPIEQEGTYSLPEAQTRKPGAYRLPDLADKIRAGTSSGLP